MVRLVGRTLNVISHRDPARNAATRTKRGVARATCHRFQHTFAIQCLRKQGSPWALQMALGHSMMEMVRRTLAIAQADLEAAHKQASPVANWSL